MTAVHFLPYWLRSPDTEPELKGDGTDTDITPGRERLFDAGGTDSRGQATDDAPRVDTKKTAPPTERHRYTVGMYASECTITREEWRRRNGY